MVGSTVLVVIVGFLMFPTAASVVRQAKYWGPLPAKAVVGPWSDSRNRILPDGTGGPLTVVTERGDSKSCLRNVIYLRVAWPVGSVVDSKSTAGDADLQRVYVRDPDVVLVGVDGAKAPAEVPSVISAAADTGFSRAGNRIFIDPAGEAYVQREDGRVEVWPRLPEMADFYCP